MMQWYYHLKQPKLALIELVLQEWSLVTDDGRPTNSKKTFVVQDLSQLSNIQLELELTRVNKSVNTHINALEDLSKICEEKYGLTLDELWQVNDSEWTRRQRLLDEYQSRINDAGLNAFEATLGQGE